MHERTETKAKQRMIMMLIALIVTERPPSQRRPLRTKSFFPTTFSLFVAILHIINLRIISADENYCVANRTVDGRNCVFPFFRNGLLLYGKNEGKARLFL